MEGCEPSYRIYWIFVQVSPGIITVPMMLRRIRCDAAFGVSALQLVIPNLPVHRFFAAHLGRPPHKWDTVKKGMVG
jgi:hypothetical protein